MSEEEKDAIDFFIHECEKYDGTIEIKGTSVGEETRILNIVVKCLKEFNDLKEIEQLHREENGKLREELEQEKEKNNNLIKQLQEQNTEIQDISRQLRQEKEKNKSLKKQLKLMQEYYKNADFIFKDKIIKFIEEELPEEEICNTCEIYDVNGIEIKEKLEKILTES